MAADKNTYTPGKHRLWTGGAYAMQGAMWEG